MSTGWFRTSWLFLAAACQSQQPTPPAPAGAADGGKAKTAPPKAVPVKSALGQRLLLEDPLTGPSLSQLWQIQLTDLDPGEAPLKFHEKSLQMGLNTLKRKPGEISVHSLVRRDLLDWSEDPITMRFGLHWLEKNNASYLSAGMLLVPEPVDATTDPRLVERNLAVFFTGVPPAARARRVVRLRKSNSTVWEDLQGWPEEKREGRSFEGAMLELTVSDDAIRLREEGHPEVLVKRPVGFTSGRFILFVASQSNAPLRWAGFHSLRVSRGSKD